MMRDLAVAVCGCLALAPALAWAAEAPAPDKSGYDLFHPTPDALLRPLCTDRPTKSTSPCTVDAGHWQLETDLTNYTLDHSGGAVTQTWFASNPTLKLGLTNSLDLEVNIAPWQSVVSKGRVSGAHSRASGVGDLYLKAKWALLGDDGGDIGFALVPYVKAPTAAAGLGNGAVEGGVIAPLNFQLPRGFSLVIDPELDLLRNQQTSGRHVNTSVLASLTWAANSAVSLSAEVWTDTDFDPSGSRTQASIDLGAAYIPPLAKTWQIDGGVNLGVNSRTPAAQVYVGLSKRF